MSSSNNITCEPEPNTPVGQAAQMNSTWNSTNTDINFRDQETYSNCQMPYTWSDILQDKMKRKFVIGGLGHMMDKDFETWVCVKNHTCAVASDAAAAVVDDAFVDDTDNAYFCFMYHEGNKTFVPWGTNKYLQLVVSPKK